MVPLGFSWGAFVVYVAALMICVGGGFIAMIASQNPVFLGPILVGLFYFYLAWVAVVEDGSAATPPRGQKGNG